VLIERHVDKPTSRRLTGALDGAVATKKEGRTTARFLLRAEPTADMV